MNNAIRRKMRQRNRVHYKAKVTQSNYQWSKYRTLRNEVIDMVRKAKNKYKQKITSQIQDKSIPPGKWWRIVKSLTKCTKKCKPSTPLDSNGKILIHPIDKADELNKYFAKISHVDNCNEPTLPPQGPGPPYSIDKIHITVQDVIDQLQNINTSKPPGPMDSRLKY